MFQNADFFIGDLSEWKVSKVVTNMEICLKIPVNSIEIKHDGIYKFHLYLNNENSFVNYK